MSVNGMSKKKGARDVCLKSGSLELGGIQRRWMKRQRGRETELRAGETTAAVQTEMSDESETFWEDAPAYYGSAVCRRG